MNEKKNKRLAILLAFLVTAIVIMAVAGRRDTAVDESYYQKTDLKAVSRVLLESRNGTVDLRYQGYRWKVNDSIDADRSLVEVLFATLQQARAKRAVSKVIGDSIRQSLKKNGVKVTLYAGEEEVQSFLAGGNVQKTQAIFVEEDGDGAHYVTIPGYRVYVSGIFEVPAVGWREKLIFNFNWQNFSRLETRYRNPAGDFDVMMQRNEVFIPQVAEADTARLNTYLDQISLLTVQEYVSPGVLTDSLAGTRPIVQLTAHDIADRRYQLDVFDSGNQFYGRINQKYWAILDERDIVPLLRPKDFFVRK